MSKLMNTRLNAPRKRGKPNMTGRNVSPCPAEKLKAILTSTDGLSLSPSGDLMLEGCVLNDLLVRFGSPLYVISETTLRTNYRRVQKAFGNAWPSAVTVLYAIKANNNLAVRAILHQEGAGGDCFGESELYATFRGGANPEKIVLNGSNKSQSLLRKAVEFGVVINIDSEDEIDFLSNLALESQGSIRVLIRLKLTSPDFASISSDYFGGPNLTEYARRSKWGFSPEAAERIVRRIQKTRALRLLGYHFHIGRASREVLFRERWAKAFALTAIELQRKTGYAPLVLDIGGGWPRERDPESRSLDLNPTPIEEYARVVCSTLLQELEKVSWHLPQLWLEPGRYIVGNAAVLLATAGAVKRDLGLTWVNLDTSTNSLMRIDTSGSAHHLFPATKMYRESQEKVTFVGETCVDSIFSTDCLMPQIGRGEPIVILDAGMYAETCSTQFNGIPRPATVLVSGSQAEIIKEREAIGDVFSKHRLLERLRAPVTA